MNYEHYIKVRIDNHRLLSDKLYNDTRDLVEKPIYAADLLKRYSPEKTVETLNSTIEKMVAQANAIDLLYNTEIKKVIKDARQNTLPEAVRNRKDPPDYQQRIGNALMLLNMHGESLTDNEAFEILKPFFNDWEQMRIFERAMSHNLENAEVRFTSPGEASYAVRSKFPRTFGGILNLADMHSALLDEAERLAERIFLNERKYDMACNIGGNCVSGAVQSETYDSICTQDRLLDLAKKIDRLQNENLIELAERADTLCAEKDDVYQHKASSAVPYAVTDKDTDFIWE